MFAIRARRKVATERDFLDAVEKVVRQGTKFSSTWVLFFSAFRRCLTPGIGLCIRCITELESYLSFSQLVVRYISKRGRELFLWFSPISCTITNNRVA